MKPYNTLLVAIDGSPSSVKVLQRAMQMAEQQAERLHVIHVIEPLALAYGADMPMDVTELQQNLIDQAKESISSLTRGFPIPEHQIHVERSEERRVGKAGRSRVGSAAWRWE